MKTLEFFNIAECCLQESFNQFCRCLPMLGPLGEDFAKVKASITTALDKITQVFFFDSVKIRWPILQHSWWTSPFQSWNLKFEVSKTFHCHPLIFCKSSSTSTGSTAQRREAWTTSWSPHETPSAQVSTSVAALLKSYIVSLRACIFFFLKCNF